MRNTAILVGLLLFAIGVPVVGTLTSDTGHDEVILVEMYQFDFDFTFENGTKVTNQVTLYTGVAYLFNVDGGVAAVYLWGDQQDDQPAELRVR